MELKVRLILECGCGKNNIIWLLSSLFPSFLFAHRDEREWCNVRSVCLNYSQEDAVHSVIERERERKRKRGKRTSKQITSNANIW